MNTWRSFDYTEPRIGSTIEVLVSSPANGVVRWRGRYISREYDQFILEQTIGGATHFFWRHVHVPPKSNN